MNPMQRVMDLDHQGVAGKPHGWIQWKGTDVCIDLRCPCGHLGHFDGDFFYYYRCPNCHTAFFVGQCVQLIPITPEEEADAKTGSGIQTSNATD